MVTRYTFTVYVDVCHDSTGETDGENEARYTGKEMEKSLIACCRRLNADVDLELMETQQITDDGMETERTTHRRHGVDYGFTR